MMMQKIFTNKFLLTIFIVGIFLTSPYAATAGYAYDNKSDFDTSSIPSSLGREEAQSISSDTLYDPTDDLGSILDDNNNTFGQTWDPWLTRAAIHAVASEGDWLALASGYLYDNQIHLYRWNPEEDQYTLVWEVGGGDFMSDVLTLAFGDTNHNNLVEIIAGGEDGRFYVFEQKHIYDPYTNTENMFELVYTSDRLGRIFDLVVEDVDGDYKEDIIVGTLETVRFFEYSDHSGYPFNEEHWIEFEESFSIDVTDNFVNYTGADNLYAITALEVADTNRNGLLEVVIGTRAGTVFLLENNGTVLDINGSPFPFMRDDNYQFIWNSSNTIQRAITDFAGGDLDRDGYKEILMVVQGIGAYILDEIDGEFGTYRIQRDYAGWESDPAGAYPLDTNIDWILNSSSLESVDGSIADFNPDNFTYYPDANVYTDYTSGANITHQGEYPEPLSNEASDGMTEIFPYRTAIAQPADGLYTVFDASLRDAWAILDWGRHEEAAGNGIPSLYDLKVKANRYFNPTVTFSLSQDAETWYNVESTDVEWVGGFANIEVDNVLNSLGWTNYRYIKVNVTSGELRVDSMDTRYFNKPIYDAQSATIGQLTMKGESTPSTVGFIGTVDGALLAVHWNDIAQDYEVIWDSWVDERYKISKNIFDLQSVKRDSTFPAWVDLASKSWEWDLTNGVLGQEKIFTYDAENFYNYRDERDTEFIVSTMSGNLHLYRQNGPDAVPSYDQFLTDMLFNTDFYGFLFPTLTQSFPTDIKTWMAGELSANNQKGLPTYFGVSVVPMDFDIGNPEETGISATFDRTESGMWLFLSSWDGQVNPETREPGDIDVSAWYLFNFPVESQDNPCYPLEECSTFLPVFNNLTESIEFDGQVLTPVTLTNSELTGQAAGIFGTSQWAPKVAGYDVIGDDNQDLIITNGKINLMEVTSFTNPRPFDTGDIDTMFGDLNTMARSDYFATINNEEKGRIWTNAEPVDLDVDGDMDLILGFARYENSTFDMNKVTYGFTYWENQGTNEEPIWVEQKKAVTNNDADSNFRVDRYTEPVLVFNDYDFGTEGFDLTYGYHPVYRTGYPTDLLMFQPLDDTNLWNGTIKRFVADYTPQTSLMLATYPEAKRVDINLQYEAGNAVNYGYHVFETWDNDDELNGWTATVQAGYDLDGDGDQEVIVGDFNNNAYVFEHLSNNTFKRAYKSQDLNRTILTGDSPYAHEEFDGIGGTFYRTIFQHAEYSIAGVDLNGNGLQEFIMATPDMIFIFESKYTPGGYIQQDTFELVAQIDILNHPALAGLPQSEIKISALAYGPDANLDGRQEIIVGVGPALLIFDVFIDAVEAPNNFDVQETYFSQTGSLRGQWRMPGNYYFFPKLQIDAIIVEDLDQDGWVDIVLGGTDKSKARQIRDGFIYMLQWDSIEWSLSIKPGIFEDTVLYTPVTALAYDDQDYDGHIELIIGHKQGVDIYEFPSDGVAEHRETITSNPHYQLPTRSYFFPLGLASGGGLNDCYARKTVADCERGETTIGEDPPYSFDHRKDVLRHSNGTLYLVTFFHGPEVSWVVVLRSQDNGITWSGAEFLWTFTSLTGFTGSRSTLNFLEAPIIAETANGAIWVGWGTRQSSNQDLTLKHVIMFTRYVSGSWTTPWVWTSLNAVTDKPFSHRLYEVPGTNTNQMGYAYLLRGEEYTSEDRLTMGTMTINTGISQYISGFYHPYINGSDYGGNFDIESFDITPLTYNSSLGVSRDYGLTFDGTYRNESLTFENDIYYGTFYANTTTLYNFTRPTRLAFTGISESNPQVIQESTKGNLMVTFQAPALRPYGGLFAMWSDDGGINWMGPYDMSHPLGIDPNGKNMGLDLRPYSSSSGESYRVGTTIGPIFMDYFAPNLPVLAEGTSSGFTMVYSIDIGFRLPRDPKESTYCTNNLKGSVYGVDSQSAIKGASSRLPECNYVEVDFTRLVSAYNPHSNFSWYHLGETTALDIGDTDDDGRREIAVASGKKAYLFEFERNNPDMILHKEEWISREYERDLTDISLGDINGNGFDDIVLTSDRGIVHAYSLLDTNVTRSNFTVEDFVARNPPTPTNPVDPFFALGSDFTSRTRFETLDISETPDGVDDVIVIDDFYVGAGDTALLRYDEEYNEVLWAHDLPQYGEFTGESALFDLDNDNDMELIIIYQHAIIGIDPYTGEIMWENSDVASMDWSNSYAKPTMRFVQFDESSAEWEIVVWSEIFDGADFHSAIHFMEFTGDTIDMDFLSYYKDPIMEVADIDGDSIDEILLVARNQLFPIISAFYVFENNFGVSYLSAISFFAPVEKILVGEFDPASDGEDWIYVSEFNSLGNFFGIDWTVLPTFFITFTFSAGSVALPSTNSYFGFSPFRGATLDSDVGDIDGDTNGYDDVVAQGSGGLFSMKTTPTAGYKYDNADVFSTSAVPYSKNSINLVDGVCADLDGIPELVTPISSSSIGCYNSADFSTTPELVWASTPVSFDILIDVIPGSFDLDGNSDDFMLIGKNGFVFIYDNGFDGLIIGANEEIPDVSFSLIGMENPTVLVILSSTIFVAIFAYIKRSKLQAIINNLR